MQEFEFIRENGKNIFFIVLTHKKDQSDGLVFFVVWVLVGRIRTHSSATPRWGVAPTSANTGGYLYFRPRRKCKSNPSSPTIIGT